ncbi:MAG: SDR family NAD(P)-dependent oxidoreductase [Elainellaceae cyanobacterium]
MAPTVLITGASQGSGKATALLFARKGYNVVLAARSPQTLEAAAADVRSLGMSALAIPTDVGDRAQVKSLVQKSLDFFGQVDVLVNNAGICLTGSMAHTTSEDWQRIMDTNFWGYVYTIQALLPQFLDRGSGVIVNVGSFGGKMPLPNMTAYCASKYAVAGLSETLHLELAPKGIHVAAVHPGVINSSFMERAMFRGGDSSEAQARRDQMQSVLGSALVSQPEDIAKAVWEAVSQKRAEVVVGPAAIATEAYRLVPGLTQWLLGRASS